MANQHADRLMRLIHGSDVFANYEPDAGDDLQGWNSDHPVFLTLLDEIRPTLTIDVGVWKGRSSIWLAHRLRDMKIDGAVLSVDTFLGSPEHWLTKDSPLAFPSLRARYGMPRLYWQFLSNVRHYEATDWIVPLPQTSGNAAVILRTLGVRAGIIHIDAAHEYDAVLADAVAFWDVLEPGGALVGDDYAPGWPGVVEAAHTFSKRVGETFSVHGPKWVMRKPR